MYRFILNNYMQLSKKYKEFQILLSKIILLINLFFIFYHKFVVNWQKLL